MASERAGTGNPGGIRKIKEVALKRGLVLALALTLSLSLLTFGTGKIALIEDVGGRGDQSFNDMAIAGAERACAEFGLTLDEVASTSENDYLPNVRNTSRAGDYDLIICTGFLLTGALNEVAPEFPDQNYAIVDVAAGPPPWNTQGPNIMNLVFHENEQSALIGALGAMTAAHYGYPKFGAVFGIPGSVLYHFEAGLRYGIDWGNKKWAALTGTDPGIGLLYNYIMSFSDEELGETSSTAMLAQGAVGVYNIAGPVGFGDHRAIVNAHAQAGTSYGPPLYFGVDANQDYFTHTLASGMKRVDVAVYEAIKAVAQGTFRADIAAGAASGEAGGYVGTLANGGVKLSKAQDLLDFMAFGIAAGAQINEYQVMRDWGTERYNLPQAIWDAISELEAGILDGSIAVPTANTDADMAAVRAQYTLGAP
jgi:basic membrane protein A